MIYAIDHHVIRCAGPFTSIWGKELVQRRVSAVIQDQVETCAIGKKQGTSCGRSTIIFFQTNDLNGDAVGIAATFFVILMNIFLNDR